MEEQSVKVEKNNVTIYECDIEETSVIGGF